MELLKYNNQRVSITTVDNEIIEGLALFEEKESYDETKNALSIKRK